MKLAKRVILNVRSIVAHIKDFFEKRKYSKTAHAGRISTTDLVNRIYNFCEVYSGRVMYPYQGQFSKRIIRSVLENDGAELTALFARQSGKCFAKDTEILMSNGEIKKVQDIRIGDYVMRPNSTPALVTSLGRGKEEMFEVRSREKNHESFVVNKSHILSVVNRKGELENISVEDYLKLPEWKKKNYYRGYRVPVDYPFKEVPIDPYFIGVWLGDGSSYDVKITNVDNEVVSYLYEYAKELGMQVSIYEEEGRIPSYAITHGNNGGVKRNIIRCYLKENNLFGNKHIPQEYMVNSKEVRLKLLAGIIDTDGYKSSVPGKDNTLEITFANKTLAEDVLRLIRSLGFRASMVLKKAKCNGKIHDAYRINAYGDFSVVPTKLSKRQWKKAELRENPLTFGFDLIPKGEDDYYGFTIDTPDHLFLLGDYTVTHNTETVAITVGGLMIILPQLANMPMFLEDTRFQMFRDGFWVGIFAPSQRQAQTTYNRMRGRMQCKEAQAVLNDPEFRLEFTTSNGQTVALSNGSFCTAISASDGANIEGESFKFIILEECQDISNYKITKSIHPMGAAYNATLCKIGTATTFKGDFYEAIQRNKKDYEAGKLKIKNHFEYNYKVVMKYNPKYEKYIEREKRSLGETSDAFRMSYNLEWIISRGMFVDINKVEKECGDEYLERVSQDHVANHVAGIDVGGGSGKNKKEADSTVITIVEVDWDNPVLMESTIDEETGEDIVYLAYNTYIKDWLEIKPEVAENYEEQYHIIMDYLSNFRISRLVIDATREASLGQRIQANVKYEVVLFTFSSKSKSEIYKHLQTEINTGRARFPMSKSVVETPEYKKFTQQLADLQKGYSGSNLVVSHPDERGAHDDYPDSWCLAVWASKDAGQVDNTETRDRSKVLGVHKEVSTFRRRNRMTARRR